MTALDSGFPELNGSRWTRGRVTSHFLTANACLTILTPRDRFPSESRRTSSLDAIYFDAIAVLVGGIYGFKSWEQIKTGKQGADAEIARAKSEAG